MPVCGRQSLQLKLAAPTADEILELYDELNFPSAANVRAALLNRGYRSRLSDVEAFAKTQTPTQLFAKGHNISRAHHLFQGQRALGVVFH